MLKKKRSKYFKYFILLLLVLLIHYIPNTSPVYSDNYIIEDPKLVEIREFDLKNTKVFPALVSVSKNLLISTKAEFAEIIALGNYIIGVHVVKSLRERTTTYTYHLVIYTDKGQIIANRTLTESMGEYEFNIIYTEKYTLAVYARETGVLVYITDLDKDVPRIYNNILGNNEFVEKGLVYSDYIIVFTNRKIYVFYGEYRLSCNRLGNGEALNIHIIGKNMFIVSAEHVPAGYKIVLEAYYFDPPIFNPAFERELGTVKTADQYTVGFTNDGFILVNDRENRIYKYFFPDITIPSINISLPPGAYMFLSAVVNGTVYVLYQIDNIVFTEIYDQELNLIVKQQLLMDTTRLLGAKFKVYAGLNSEYILAIRFESSVVPETNIFDLLIISKNHGLISFHRFSSENNIIEKYMIIHKGSLLALDALYQPNDKVPRKKYLVLATLDCSYFKLIGPIKTIYKPVYIGGETTIVIALPSGLKLVSIKSVSVAIADGIPCILTYYWRSWDETFTYTISNPPLIFTIKAGKIYMRCISLKGYTGLYDLYQFEQINVPENNIFLINTTSFSSHLVVKGSSATLLVQDASGSYPAFILEHTGSKTDYYLPPGVFVIKILRGSTVIGQTTIILEKGKTTVIDIDSIQEQNVSNNILDYILEFISENISVILTAVILFIMVILILNLVLTRSSE